MTTETNKPRAPRSDKGRARNSQEIDWNEAAWFLDFLSAYSCSAIDIGDYSKRLRAKSLVILDYARRAFRNLDIAEVREEDKKRAVAFITDNGMNPVRASGAGRPRFHQHPMTERPVLIPDDLWSHAKSQPGGASAYIRSLIEAEMREQVLLPSDLIA